MPHTIQKKSAYIIILLILSGEAVFILPFVLARIFRPTFLEVFNINNFEIGTCFSVYGIVALFSYLFGGPLADRFQPRYLISLALMLTALGGFYMATYPSHERLLWLFAYFGFTTIFLFWSAMIKATRIWGGQTGQGLAFGFLDGGRGLVAAGFGTLGVIVFSFFVDGDVTTSTFEERQKAFGQVLVYSSVIVFVVGLLVLFFLKQNADAAAPSDFQRQKIQLKDFRKLLKLPSVWLLMVIILCAYYGYKMTDYVSQYANEVMLFDSVDAAKIGTSLLYLRPLIGVVVGLAADKTRASFWIVIGFVLMLLSSIFIATGVLDQDSTVLFFSSVIFMAVGVYSARVLYFAAFSEGLIPISLMGTAVGLVSIIGFTPDIFSGPLAGSLLDNHPGELGHRYVFAVMAGFSIIGLIAAVLFYGFASTKGSKTQDENH